VEAVPRQVRVLLLEGSFEPAVHELEQRLMRCRPGTFRRKWRLQYRPLFQSLQWPSEDAGESRRDGSPWSCRALSTCASDISRTSREVFPFGGSFERRTPMLVSCVDRAVIVGQEGHCYPGPNEHGAHAQETYVHSASSDCDQCASATTACRGKFAILRADALLSWIAPALASIRSSDHPCNVKMEPFSSWMFHPLTARQRLQDQDASRRRPQGSARGRRCATLVAHERRTTIASPRGTP
jgi:hypothetical protein